MLRSRLRAVDKEIYHSGGQHWIHLRAIALERQRNFEICRAEAQAEEARTKELEALAKLRGKEAEIMK